MSLTLAKENLWEVHRTAFEEIIGEQFVFVSEESINNYASDETENLHFPPDIVVKPRTAEEISAVMKICNQYKIPVTPRGAGTGLSGGALANHGGVLISFERMNSFEIDERNLQVTTEPGVITEVFETGANDVLVVKNNERERLVPFTEQAVLEVDIANKTMLVDWDAEF